MRDVIMIAEICAYTDCKDCPFYEKDGQLCLLRSMPQFWNTKKIGDIIDETKKIREGAENNDSNA